LLTLGFTDKSVSAIQALIGFSEKIRENKEQLLDAGGAMKSVADKQLEAFIEKMKLLKRQVIDTALTIGKQLAPAIERLSERLKPILKSLDDMATSFAKLDPDIQLAIIGIATLVAAIGPLLVAVGFAAIGLAGITTALGGKGLLAVTGAAATALSTRLVAGLTGLGLAAAGATPFVTALSGALFLTATAIAAVKVGRLVSAFREMRESEQKETDSTKERLRQLALLEIRLRQHGVDISDTQEKYNQGLIPLAEYERKLFDLAKAAGGAKEPLQGLGDAATDLSKTFDEAEIAKAFSTLGIVDVVNQLKKAQDAFRLLLSAGVLSANQIAEAMEILEEKTLAVESALGKVTTLIKATQDFVPPPLGFVIPEGTDIEKAQSDLAELRRELVLLKGVSEQPLPTTPTVLLPELGKLPELSVDKTTRVYEDLQKALDRVGTSTQDLHRNLAQAEEDLKKIRAAATRSDVEASATDILRAQHRLNEARLAMLRDLAFQQTGITKRTTEEEIKQLEKVGRKNRETLDKMSGDHRRKTGEMAAFWRGFGNQVSTIITDLSRNIVDILFPRGGGAQRDTAAITALGLTAGVTGQQLDDLADAVENLALATGQSFGSVAEGAAELFRVFQIPAGEQIPLLRTLFAVTKTTGIGIDDLMRGLTGGAAVFKSLGLSVEESAVLLGKLSVSGEDVSSVMGSLNTALKKLSEQGFTDPGAALRELIQRIQDAGTESEATELAVRHFGSAGQEMARIIRAGHLDLSDFNLALDRTGGGLEEAADKSRELQKETSKLKQVFTDLGRAMVRAFIEQGMASLIRFLGKMGALKKIGQGIVDIFKQIGQWLGIINKGVGGFSDLTASIGGVSRSVGAVGGGVGSIPSGAGGGGGLPPGGLTGLGFALGGPVGAAIAGAAELGIAIAGLFQGARRETTLNAIEENTRFNSLYNLAALIKFNEFLPGIQAIHDRWVDFIRDHAWRIHDVWEELTKINAALVGGTSLRPAVATAGNLNTASVRGVRSGGDSYSFYVDGRQVAGEGRALDLMREGARMLVAKGVRRRRGIRT
jgi:hypothetical protein